MEASDYTIRYAQAQAAAVCDPVKFEGFYIHSWYIDGYGWSGEIRDAGNNLMPNWMNTQQGYTHRFMAVDFMKTSIVEYRSKLEAVEHQMQRTACTHPEKKIIGAIPYCKVCGEQLD